MTCAPNCKRWRCTGIITIALKQGGDAERGARVLAARVLLASRLARLLAELRVLLL